MKHQSISPTINQHTTPGYAKWRPPLRDAIKINTDGSVKQNGTSHIAFIFRNSDGKPTFYYSARSSSSSVLQTEANALLKAVHMALAHGTGRTVVESDNLALINAINGTWSIPWSIQDTVEDIKLLRQSFHYIKFTHCRRQANRAADFLATKCISTLNSSSFNVPRDLLVIIRRDVLGYTS